MVGRSENIISILTWPYRDFVFLSLIGQCVVWIYTTNYYSLYSGIAVLICYRKIKRWLDLQSLIWTHMYIVYVSRRRQNTKSKIYIQV